MGQLRSGSVHHFNIVSLSFLNAYDFLVFTETPFFSEKKSFKIFILEICVKWYKYSRVEVAIAGKCKCVRFIYFRKLSWKCIFQWSVSVKSKIFLSAFTMVKPAGDSISSSSFLSIIQWEDCFCLLFLQTWM